jgi:uncharacterized SAM-binding protein YcdF (DUF218 family)
MTFKEFLHPFNAALTWAMAVVRMWWRPLTQLGLAAAIWVNGVIVPLATKTYPDLTALAALVTAVVAAFGVRAWEKHKGLG